MRVLIFIGLILLMGCDNASKMDKEMDKMDKEMDKYEMFTKKGREFRIISYICGYEDGIRYMNGNQYRFGFYTSTIENRKDILRTLQDPFFDGMARTLITNYYNRIGKKQAR